MLRETIVCSALITWATNSIGSLPMYAIAACAPLPVATISKTSYAPISGPGRIANQPSGLRGQLCMPYTARIGNLSNSPSSTITRPPPSFSSAG
jgi:hypothetical protein